MKEWKYRFKRGLASFLTVGMIASGVNAATCLPVYAVEDGSDVGLYSDAGLEGNSQKVYTMLKQKISTIFKDPGPANTKFRLSIDYVDTNMGNKQKEYNKLVDEINENMPLILDSLLEDYSSDLFWYEGLDYFEPDPFKTDDTKAKWSIWFAVKPEYRLEPGDPTSINALKVKQIKAAGEKSSDFEEASGKVYDNVRKQILDLFAENAPDKTKAEFTVSVFSVDNKEEYNILKGMIESNVGNIESRLLEDCPSELFWYAQSSFSLDNKKSYKWAVWSPDPDFTQAGPQQVYFTLKLAVKERYRQEGVSDSNEKAISLNVTEIRKEKAAIDDILKTEEGLSESDYDILNRYREKICVFAGTVADYANAFWYMCNQTTFLSKGTQCNIVTGTKNGNTYTWNIVSIGGKNYLVDLAECAKGNSGEYFLVGAQMQHDEKDGYTIANGTKYVPDDGNGKWILSGLKYKQEQADFKFERPVLSADKTVKCVVGDVFIVEVSGNVFSNISFESSNTKVATVTTDPVLGDNAAIVHVIGAGDPKDDPTYITATAFETDAREKNEIKFKLEVEDKPGNNSSSGEDPEDPSGDPGTGGNPGNGNGTGGNTGGSGTGTGGGNGGGGNGVSVTYSGGSGPRELLPQIDFRFMEGSTEILKSVGAPDFTLTVSGQVKDSKVTYASSDPSVATVDANGTVHIVGAGTATITATASATTIHREEKCECKLKVS